MEPASPKAPDSSPETEAALTPTTVSHCTTLNEAQMVVGLLASFGIPANIDAENYNRMFGSMVPAFGGVQVQVRQLDAEAAREILDQKPDQLAGEE
jgi:hypothetical protein